MRLLKIGWYEAGDEKLEMIQRWGKDVPHYAILSHTWNTDPECEVLLSDIQRGTFASKPSYPKLKKAMEGAKLDGYDWLWVDTCCIDQTSNVELSEAINSMYNYYKNSGKCYVYLSDVESELVGETFKNARWWKRGWTLQELLAPSRLEFFSAQWKSIGYKNILHKTITEITGIEEDYLNGTLPVEQASVAKRMSWAASRETTREEDIAYSLIGIFDVTMPMLYGEGAVRAFVRLQEEILKLSEDQSIFAWVKRGNNSSETRDEYHGLLADSPNDFAYTGHVIPYTVFGNDNPCTMTARGLHMTLPLRRQQDGKVIAALRCPNPEREFCDWLAVYLQPLHTGADQFTRVDSSELASISEIGASQQVYVPQHIPKFGAETIYPYHFYYLRSCSYNRDRMLGGLTYFGIVDSRSAQVISPAKTMPVAKRIPWCSVPRVYQINKIQGSLTTALLIRRSPDQEAFVIMLGTTSRFATGVAVCEADALEPFDRMQEAFSPQQPGKYVELKYHGVRVSIKEDFQADWKIYNVDIEISAFPKASITDKVVAKSTNTTAKVSVHDKLRRFSNKVKRPQS